MMIYFHHLSAVLLVMIFKFSDCHLLFKKIIMIELVSLCIILIFKRILIFYSFLELTFIVESIKISGVM